MSDGMTEEQRAKLAEWMRQDQGTPDVPTPLAISRDATEEGKRLIAHLEQELDILQDVSENEETLVGLFYYAQAIADLRYFVEHGVSQREGNSAHERGRQGMMVGRKSMKWDEQES